MSHTVVLRPLKAGYFNFTSATITYLAQEGGQVVVSDSAARGISPHTEQWSCLSASCLFGDAACPCGLKFTCFAVRREGSRYYSSPFAFFRWVSRVLPGREESWLSVSSTGGSPLTL